jgi:hypothetical protein
MVMLKRSTGVYIYTTDDWGKADSKFDKMKPHLVAGDELHMMYASRSMVKGPATTTKTVNSSLKPQVVRV